MSRLFRVVNFEEYQHYKDRSPPWIKLYSRLLEHYEFGALPDASKAHLIAIWLLASRNDNRLHYDADWIGKRINATELVNLDILERSGFIEEIQTRSKTLAKRKQSAEPETETETETEREKEREKNLVHPKRANDFDSWWQAFPRKQGKEAAKRKYAAIVKSEQVSPEVLLAGAHKLAKAGLERQFTPMPLTWLNQGRWSDEDAPAATEPNRNIMAELEAEERANASGRRVVGNQTAVAEVVHERGSRAGVGRKNPIDDHALRGRDAGPRVAEAEQRLHEIRMAGPSIDPPVLPRDASAGLDGARRNGRPVMAKVQGVAAIDGPDDTSIAIGLADAAPARSDIGPRHVEAGHAAHHDERSGVTDAGQIPEYLIAAKKIA